MRTCGSAPAAEPCSSPLACRWEFGSSGGASLGADAGEAWAGQASGLNRPGASFLDTFWGLNDDGEVLLAGPSGGPSPAQLADDLAADDDDLAMFRAYLASQSLRFPESAGSLIRRAPALVAPLSPLRAAQRQSAAAALQQQAAGVTQGLLEAWGHATSGLDALDSMMSQGERQGIVGLPELGTAQAAGETLQHQQPSSSVPVSPWHSLPLPELSPPSAMARDGPVFPWEGSVQRNAGPAEERDSDALAEWRASRDAGLIGAVEGLQAARASPAHSTMPERLLLQGCPVASWHAQDVEHAHSSTEDGTRQAEAGADAEALDQLLQQILADHTASEMPRLAPAEAVAAPGSSADPRQAWQQQRRSRSSRG